MDSSASSPDFDSFPANTDECPIADIIKALPIPVFIKSKDGVHALCNQRFLDILGTREEDVIGHRVEDFAPEGLTANAIVNDQRLRDSDFKASLSYRTEFIDFNGKKRFLEIAKSSFEHKPNHKIWIIGTVLDVTEEVGYHNELARQHKFLRTIIDNLPQTIFTKDKESRFTLANKATAQLVTGHPNPSLLMGKSDSDFYRPELWVKYYNDEQEVIRTGTPLVNIVELVEDTKGNIRWNNTSKIPLYGEDGEINGTIGIGSDFTQFKKTEEQLRLQSTALEAAADGITIADRQGNILWANTAMSTITGYSMAEIIGSTSQLFKSGHLSEDFYKNIWLTITSGKTWKGEIINRRKDGVLRTEESTITPVQNESGRISHFVSICRDVTEREALRQEMSSVYAAVSRAKDALLLVSKERKPFFINKAFSMLLGYTMNELPAEVISKIVYVDDNDGWDGPASNTNRDGTRVRQEELIALNGDRIPVEIRDWPVNGNNEEDLGQVFVLRDLRDERRLEEEQKMMDVRMRQAQKMEAIGQLAAGIAHEINNPIQFVGNNTSFLSTSFSDLTRLIDAQKRALEKAGTAADLSEVNSVIEEIDYSYLQTEVPEAITQTLEGVHRVSDIVKAMKDFSHPGTKNRQRTDLNKAVKDAILVARNEWKYNSDIITDLTPDLPTALCLAGEVNQVILNLLVNSAHAINDAVAKGRRERGTITLKTEYDSKELRIILSDDGCGIPMSIQDRVFEPFFTTKEVGKGTGQGLAIAYDVIVRKHKGRLSFKSIEGTGTTFVVALPIGTTTETEK